MKKITHLTVGVLARDGLPHLQMCLQSLPALADCAGTVDFLLVDSASRDATLKAMCAFASRGNRVRVFAMKGAVNQSATRNVILDNAAPGAVLLIDGDVAISRDFVLSGLEEIAAGNAEIVHGQLPEIWHTSAHRAYADGGDRYQIYRRCYTPYFMGNVLLGPQVLASGCRYDLQMRRFEDVEFSIRISEQFRILALPIPIGTHYTIQYHSPYRIGAFYRDAYLRPAGRFIRINLRRPWRLWRSRRIFIGHLIGFAEQLCLVIAAVSLNGLATAIVAAVIAADILRFASNGRIHQFVPIRVRGPWQILAGTFMEKPVNLDYETIEIPVTPSSS